MYYSGFLPKDDHDAMLMNNKKIREICSALECEMEHAKYLRPDQNPDFDSLIRRIKEFIKEHRKSEESLPAKTYDFMFGSIKHWNFSLADKIWAMYQRYENALLQKTISALRHMLRREDIDIFVKYRNNLTHGSAMIIGQDVAEIAFILINMISCCILERIGFSLDEIARIVEMGFIS